MPRKEIFESLKNDFVLCSQYTDDTVDSKPAALLLKYSADDLTVPLYLIVDHEGNELARLGWPGDAPTMDLADFAKLLETGKEKFAAQKK